MTCGTCDQDPCICQRAVVVRRQPRPWVVVPCANPDCDSQIRMLPGVTDTPTLCKWCRGDNPYNLRPRPIVHPDDGPTMTKEEFGLDLYNAIVAKTKGDHVTLKQILDKNTIGAADLKRLLAIP